MNFILFDDPVVKEALLPLTYLRPISGIRVGVWTITEKWQREFGEVSFLADKYLSNKYPLIVKEDNICINGAVCPNEELVARIKSLGAGSGLYFGETLIAFRGGEEAVRQYPKKGFDGEREEVEGDFSIVNRTWKIFQRNGHELRHDIDRIRDQGDFEPVRDEHTRIYSPENVLLGKNVEVKGAIIDADDGPVYIGDNCIVRPGAIIKGPFAMLNNSELNMGARMRGDITIGPHCKIGGEVSNSIIFGYSNKAHDGFLGNSVIGEWCNMGADTNTSNMKNDYSEVKVWNYGTNRFETSGSIFCGLVMGDHSKSGINVMFNSGTTVGVSASIFNANYPRNFIPSFVKGGANGWNTMRLKAAFQVATRTMERRKIDFDETEEKLFEKVFELSSQYRRS